MQNIESWIVGVRSFASRAVQPLLMLTASVGVVALCAGCAHTLEVKNLNEYQKSHMTPLAKPMTIGVVATPECPEGQKIGKGVGRALASYSAKVLLPYTASSNEKADVVANLAFTHEYKGSGWNFLINWPGFLVFAPAWNGYVYRANFQVDVNLTKGANGNSLDSWSMPISLDLRHAEIDRTWTEIGWLEVGIIPFIGGIAFTAYDTDVTPILLDRIEGPIGDYVAQEIVMRINKNGTTVSSSH